MLRSLSAGLVVGALALPAADASASVPAAPAAAAVVTTLPEYASAGWVASADGSVVAVGSKTTWPRVDIVDVASGSHRVIVLHDSAYDPPVVGLSRDGRFLSWTSDVFLHNAGRGVAIYDPTLHVRDLEARTSQEFRRFDGAIGGDGSVAAVIRGPVAWRGNYNGTPAAAGVLDLASGDFRRLPFTPTPQRHVDVMSMDLHGDRVIVQIGKQCLTYAFATHHREALGRCDGHAFVRMSDDGSVAFSSNGGYRDPESGAPLPSAIPTTLFSSPTSRLAVQDAIGPDLSQLVVTCWPGTDKLTDVHRRHVPLRTYILDRNTGLASLLPAPSGTTPDTSIFGFENGPAPKATLDGSELFWTVNDQLFRGPTVGAAPAPLPAECMPS